MSAIAVGRRRRKRILGGLWVALAVTVLGTPCDALRFGGSSIGETPEATSFMVGAGRWGLKSGDEHAAAVDVELRHRPLRYGIFPLAGLVVNSEEGWSPRLGLGRRFPLGGRWDATVTFATCAYFPGDGKDLGHTLEFRSALDLGFQIRPTVRLGLSVAHFSNAGLSERNPGVETLSLTLATNLRP